jgi:NADH-quinone oxidoreductase subunit L
VTAFYMTRAVALTFFGTYKGHGEPHESPRIMTGPLVGLAIPSILFGLLNIPGVSYPGIGNFTEWLGVRVVTMGDHHAEAIDFFLAGVGLGAALLGIAIGWMIWGKDRDTQEARDTFGVPGLYPLLRRKYFVDDAALGVVGATTGPIARFVDWTNTYILDGIVNAVGGATKFLGGLVYNGLDQLGVDGIFNGLSAVADSAGGSLRKLQTGRVQQYASGFVAGALILVVLFVFVI